MNLETGYKEKDPWYRDFWFVQDTSAVMPKGPNAPDDWPDEHPTVVLCDSEAIAKRVAELVSGDAELAALVRQENGIAT